MRGAKDDPTVTGHSALERGCEFCNVTLGRLAELGKGAELPVLRPCIMRTFCSCAPGGE